MKNKINIWLGKLLMGAVFLGGAAFSIMCVAVSINKWPTRTFEQYGQVYTMTDMQMLARGCYCTLISLFGVVIIVLVIATVINYDYGKNKSDN